MKTLIFTFTVSMIALGFVACTANDTSRTASTRHAAAGVGKAGYNMPPAENVHQAEGGDLVLQIQRRGPGNSQL